MKSPLYLMPLAFLLLLGGARQAGAQCPLSDVEPESVRRGTTTTLVLSGTDLSGAAVEVDDPRIQIVDIETSDTEIELTITVGQRSVAGPKDLLVTPSGEAEETCADAFDVTPGNPSLLALVPNELQRGDSGTFEVQGLSLDDVTTLDLGDGIAVTNYEADPTDPTRATVDIAVGDTAEAGEHDVTVVADEPAVLADGFTVVPGPLEVTGMTPAVMSRGETETLVFTGRNLDTVERGNLGNGVALGASNAVDPTELEIEASVSADSLPVGATRDVTLFDQSGSVVLEDAFMVEAGVLDVTRIRPDRLSQGSTIEVTVEGANLDGVDQFDAGTDIEVDEIDALSPTRVVVTLTVGEEAAVGVRDVSVMGAFGSDTVDDGLVIIQRTIPPVQVNYPDVFDAGRVEVGARKRVSLVFRNEADVEEPVTLELISGDIDEFRLFDPAGETLTEAYPEVMSFTLTSFEERVVTVEYRPTLRAASAANVRVEARGESQGDIEMRGTGVQAVLSFSPPPPVTVPPVMEGEVGSRQISTLSATSDRVEIEEVAFLIEQNNAPFAEAEERTIVLLSNPLPPETAHLFGATLITLQTDYDAGTYEGELWIETDRTTAPLLVVSFSTTVTPDPNAEEDSGDEPGDEPAEDEGDVAADVGPEVGDVGEDFGAPDVEQDPGGDVQADAGGGGGGDEGCCAQGSGRGVKSGWPIAVVVAGLVLTARRRK